MFGVFLSLLFQALSAAFIKYYPFHDYPTVPKPVFIFLLFPGLALAGCLSLDEWSRTVIIFAANCIFYGLIIFGFVSLCAKAPGSN